MTGFAAAFSNNNFPTTPANRYAAVEANGTDAFLSRLSANGTALEYSTGIGTDGSGGNDGSDFAQRGRGRPDGRDRLHRRRHADRRAVTDFPLKNQYEGRSGACCFGLDAFVSKFDTNGVGSQLAPVLDDARQRW